MQRLPDHHPCCLPHAPRHPAHGRRTHPLKLLPRPCCTPAERCCSRCRPLQHFSECGPRVQTQVSCPGPNWSPQSVGEALGPRVRSKLLITPVSPFTAGCHPPLQPQLLAAARSWRHGAFAYGLSPPAACSAAQGPFHPLRPLHAHLLDSCRVNPSLIRLQRQRAEASVPALPASWELLAVCPPGGFLTP